MGNYKYFKNYTNSQYEEYCNGIFTHGEQVNARYIEQTELTFQRNELIEALPPERDIEKCFEGLYMPPVFSTIERGKSKTYRINAIFRLMNYVTPVLKNFEIDKILSIIIRHGYISKRIKSPEYIKELKKYSDLLTSEYIKVENNINCVCDSSSSSASGFSLFGISGVGKTTAINNSLSYYPQIIKHTGNEEDRFLFRQITWIKIDCSYNGGIKGVCQKFFQEVDKLIYTDYLRIYGTIRNTIERMIIAMAHLSLKHGLGVLVIDEIQHLCGNVNEEYLLNYFVTMMNEIKLPVVYIGTYKAYKTILGKDFRHARRATGISNIRWDRLQNNEEWDMFISDLWKYQWTTKEAILTQEIKNLMREKTGGITDRIIKLFMAIQVKAIETGTEMINPNIIKKVAKENFELTADMIEALEKGDLKKLAMYDDLYSPDINEMMETAKQMKLKEDVKTIYDNNIKSEKNKELQIRNNIEIAMCQFGYDSKKIRKSLDDVIKAYGIEKDESFLLKQICKILIADEDTPIKNKQTVKGKTKKITKEEQDNFSTENIKKDF